MPGRKPQMPQNAAGARIEPLVSEPRPSGTTPAAIAAAVPADEPPVILDGSQDCAPRRRSHSPRRAAGILVHMRQADGHRAGVQQAAARPRPAAGASACRGAAPASVGWPRRSNRFWPRTAPGQRRHGQACGQPAVQRTRRRQRLGLQHAREHIEALRRRCPRQAIRRDLSALRLPLKSASRIAAALRSTPWLFCLGIDARRFLQACSSARTMRPMLRTRSGRPRHPRRAPRPPGHAARHPPWPADPTTAADPPRPASSQRPRHHQALRDRKNQQRRRQHERGQHQHRDRDAAGCLTPPISTGPISRPGWRRY